MGEQQDGGRLVPDPTQVADLDGLTEALVRMRAQAGNPPYRTLAKQISRVIRPPREIPFSTVVSVFKPGRRRLDLDLLRAVVLAMGADARQADAWRQAYLRVHADAASGGPISVLRQLPADLPTFIGREHQLRRLLKATQAERHRPATVVISAIEGMGGVGKTQLAVRAAHELVRSGHCSDAGIYVNLHGFDAEHPPSDPAAVLGVFLRQLGVSDRGIPDALAERSAMFRDRLHGRRAVIVLDNAADETQIQHLIPASPGCLVLITSRRTLSGLDGAEVLQLDVFEETEALGLLTRILGRDRVDAEPEAAAAIARSCGNLPLAVNLAAARLRARPTWTLTGFAERLRGSDLSAMSVGSRSLSAAFDLSYSVLPDHTRRLYRLLGLFPGYSFAADAAAALADLPVADTAQALEALADVSLLEAQDSGYYTFHDLLRAYARRQADQEEGPERQRAAFARVVGWYLYASHEAAAAHGRIIDLGPLPPGAARTDPPVSFTDYNQAIAWFDAERATLLAVTRLCDAYDFAPATWLMPSFLKPYHTQRGAWAELQESVETGLGAARRHGELSKQGSLLTGLAYLHYYNKRFDQGILCSEQALEVYQQLGDAPRTASAMVALADCLAGAGHIDRAVAWSTKAIAAYRSAGRLPELGRSLSNMSYAMVTAGRCGEAVPLAQEALELAVSLGSRKDQASALENLGSAYRGLGRISEAAAALQSSVDAFRDVDDRFLGGGALDLYADVLWLQGETTAAEDAWSTAAHWLENESPERAEQIREKRDGRAGPVVDGGHEVEVRGGAPVRRGT